MSQKKIYVGLNKKEKKKLFRERTGRNSQTEALKSLLDTGKLFNKRG